MAEPVLGLRSNPRSCSQPRPQDREHGEADLEGSRYRAGTASPTKDDVGAVSSESLGHPRRCRFLHHRNLDFRGSGHVLRFLRHSTEDPPVPSLDTHTEPRPSLHETSRVDLAAFNDSFLRGYSHLIIDRDSKYTTEFREILKENDVDVVPIPPKSPNCNPHAERFVRSVKEECLDRMILFGRNALERALREYRLHCLRERNQGPRQRFARTNFPGRGWAQSRVPRATRRAASFLLSCGGLRAAVG